MSLESCFKSPKMYLKQILIPTRALFEPSLDFASCFGWLATFKIHQPLSNGIIQYFLKEISQHLYYFKKQIISFYLFIFHNLFSAPLLLRLFFNFKYQINISNFYIQKANTNTTTFEWEYFRFRYFLRFNRGCFIFFCYCENLYFLE